MNDIDTRPVVFAYDGSDPARAAIAHAGRTLRHAHRSVLVVRDD